MGWMRIVYSTAFSSACCFPLLAYFGFSCCCLVVQKHRLGKIMYKPKWFSHCTKIIPLFTSELIRVTEKLDNRISCTKNIRGGLCFWLEAFDKSVRFLWFDFFLWNENTTTKNNLAQPFPLEFVLILDYRNNKHIKEILGNRRTKKKLPNY